MKNKDIIESSELPLDCNLYLKKDNLSSSGYRQVYPIKDNNGNWLWKNIFFQGSNNFFWMIFFILMIFGFIFAYNHDTAEMQKVVSNPCDYCDCFNKGSTLIYPNLDNITNYSGAVNNFLPPKK